MPSKKLTVPALTSAVEVTRAFSCPEDVPAMTICVDACETATANGSLAAAAKEGDATLAITWWSPTEPLVQL